MTTVKPKRASYLDFRKRKRRQRTPDEIRSDRALVEAWLKDSKNQVTRCPTVWADGSRPVSLIGDLTIMPT